MTDIVKDFPGVRALKGVQLKVRPGTVHTLMEKTAQANQL